MENTIIIDLGAGPNKFPGSLGIDLNPRAGAVSYTHLTLPTKA